MKLGIILAKRKMDEEDTGHRIIKIETNNNDFKQIIDKSIYINKHYKETDVVTRRKTFDKLCDLLDEIVKPYCKADEAVIFACTADGYAFIYDDEDLVNETMKYIFNE